jgi:hypothetical protein
MTSKRDLEQRIYELEDDVKLLVRHVHRLEAHVTIDVSTTGFKGHTDLRTVDQMAPSAGLPMLRIHTGRPEVIG